MVYAEIVGETNVFPTIVVRYNDISGGYVLYMAHPMNE